MYVDGPLIYMHASLDTLILHVRVYAGNMHNSLGSMAGQMSS